MMSELSRFRTRDLSLSNHGDKATESQRLGTINDGLYPEAIKFMSCPVYVYPCIHVASKVKCTTKTTSAMRNTSAGLLGHRVSRNTRGTRCCTHA